MWRTLQFIPASQEKMLNKVEQSAADALIFDLEDSVTISEKEKARMMLKSFLERFVNKKRLGIIVRINTLETFGEADLRTLASIKAIDAFMLPKAGSDAVHRLESMLSEEESEDDEKPHQIIALIETAEGILDARQIALSSERVRGMLFGAEDFSAQMGILRTAEGSEISTARAIFAMACKAAEIEAYDTPFTDITDETGLAADTETGKRLGMTGKAIIHPKQSEIVNRIYTPSDEEVEKAKRIIAANEIAVREGKGAFSVDGKMVDAPVVRRAQHILDLYLAANGRDSSLPV